MSRLGRLGHLGHLKWIAAGLIAVQGAWAAADGPELSLDAFLDQVRSGNQGYRAQSASSAGALDRVSEAGIPLSPAFFANARVSRDAKLPQLPFFSYDALDSNTFSLGLSQLTTFGLQARLSYGFGYTSFINPMFPTGQAPNLFFHEASPSIELTQSLWSNGFGAGTRATRDMSEAQSLAAHYGQRFQARASLASAEMAYWRLATARQLIRVALDAQARAETIRAWSARRERFQLADKSDALQAVAALEVRKLQTLVAKDEEVEASREFNAARGVDGDTVSENLPLLEASEVLSLQAPARMETRDDVKAAAETERQARAGADAAIQRDLPTLELFGAYAMNGRDATLNGAMGDSFDSGRPTEAVGVRLQVPLDLGALSKGREGWRKEQFAAEEAYRRKVFDEQTEWKSLNTRLAQSRRRLEMAYELEKLQGQKALYERSRHERGRTTTYQVVQFEQDYSQAQLSRIRAQSELLMVLSQMKLYGERL